MPRNVPREDAIKEYGLHYEPGLSDISTLDLHASAPRTLAERITRYAQRSVSDTVTLVETLGPATEDFHFRTAKDAAARLIAERRQTLKETGNALSNLISSPEAIAALTQEAQTQKPDSERSLAIAFGLAAAKIEEISKVLQKGFKTDIRPLQDVIALPEKILNVGDTVHVLRKTDTLPVLSTEKVAARDISGFAPFSTLDVSVKYILAEQGAAVPVKNSDTFVFAAEDDGKRVKGVVGVGRNILAFARAADAKAALRDIVSEKIEQLDAERQSLVNTLRHEGLSPRRKPRGPQS